MSSTDAMVVLVHGAWADGSSWAKVITPLAASGVKAVAAPLPLTSFHDDVAALDRTLERAVGSVVLAGHAFAGAVIGATRSDKVKALVYVAALAPDEGETVADVFYRGKPHPQAPKLAPDAHGFIYLPEAAFAAAFAQNASKEELAVLAAVQRPISPACITVAVERPLWKDRPAWFLVAEQDRMIVEDNHRFMAERALCSARHQDRLDAGYLLAYLASPACQNWLSAQSRGAMIQHLNRAVLDGLQIPLPSLQMQARAAAQFREFGTDVLTFLSQATGASEPDRAQDGGGLTVPFRSQRRVACSSEFAW